MEKEKNGKSLAIVALLVAVIGLSVGFAALSTTLRINGTVEVKESNWQIKFANLGATPSETGFGKQLTAPTLTDTKVGDFNVSLMAPGDSVAYSFDVVNGGTYAAKISSITMPTPECTGTGANAETDATNMCQNLVYTLKYDTGANVSANDTLAVGETRHLVLTIGYDENATSETLPKGKVSITGLEIPVVYVVDYDATTTGA